MSFARRYSERPLRIAQVAPLFESVPPQLYGGTERIVSYLTEELVRQGHRVTLFASGDSVTQAELDAVSPRSLRLDPSVKDPLPHLVLLLDRVMSRAHEFDLIHFHVDFLSYPLFRWSPVPQITTLHGRLDLPDLQPLYRQFPHVPLVSISDAQREPLKNVQWWGTVLHGLPTDLYRPREACGEYLAFLGRISPEKRVDRAIEIAKRSGFPLMIAAKVDVADREYFEKEIRPLMEQNAALVTFRGEIGDSEKESFLGRARALLFPIDWPEPFGLVMIEAMACGTPVIAFEGGSVREVLDEKATGFIVNNIQDAVAAVRRVEAFDRKQCRRIFEKRFSAERMAKDYLRVYHHLISEERGKRGFRKHSSSGRHPGRQSPVCVGEFDLSRSAHAGS